ncbi:gp53-like domain-containing protein [Escherichia coli]|uniref:gp53-like domain-containing protein n=1 Tax=Escherichia coli TaxID=562 RepID=UPI003F8804BC
MHRIDTKTAQKDKFGAGKNGFTRGNPQTGTPATDLDDDYFDMLQEELCSVVEASGASLEKARHDQLLTALRSLLLSRKNPFGDIKSDGTVQTALENLSLGEAAKQGVATTSQMQEGTATNLVPSVKAVMSLFPNRNFSIPGYIRIPDVPGGLVIQWGNYTTTSGSQDVNLPFNYSVAQAVCVAIYNGPANIYGYVTAQVKNTAQVTLHGRNSTGTPAGGTFYVISIGF